MTKRLNQKEKTVTLGFHTTKHTRKMVAKLQQKMKIGRSETIRQAIESTFLQEFHEGKEQ